MKFTQAFKQTHNRQHGGAALEYILVSIFGLILSLTTLSFVKSAIEEQLNKVESELGIELELNKLDIFDGR